MFQYSYCYMRIIQSLIIIFHIRDKAVPYENCLFIYFFFLSFFSCFNPFREIDTKLKQLRQNGKAFFFTKTCTRCLTLQQAPPFFSKREGLTGSQFREESCWGKGGCLFRGEGGPSKHINVESTFEQHGSSLFISVVSTLIFG